MIQRHAIVEEARKWLGTKWVHQGRNKFGIDCAGLLCVVGWGLGIDVKDKKGYQRVPDKAGFIAHLRSELTQGNVRAIKDGSVGVFTQSLYPCHTGIFCWNGGQLYLIHSTASRRKVVEEKLDGVRPEIRLTGVLEFPGVAE